MHHSQNRGFQLCTFKFHVLCQWLYCYSSSSGHLLGSRKVQQFEYWLFRRLLYHHQVLRLWKQPVTNKEHCGWEYVQDSTSGLQSERDWRDWGHTHKERSLEVTLILETKGLCQSVISVFAWAQVTDPWAETNIYFCTVCKILLTTRFAVHEDIVCKYTYLDG